MSRPGHTLSPVTYMLHPRTLLAVRRSLVVWSGVELKLGRVKDGEFPVSDEDTLWCVLELHGDPLCV